MSRDVKNYYDNLYRKEDSPFGGGEPLDVVQKIPQYADPGHVLDIGGGDGRNAFFLAKAGFTVDVFDPSEVGIKKIKRRAEQEGLDINASVSKASEFSFGKDYDIVVLSFVLHHIEREKSLNLINRMRKNTKKGGLNAVGGITKKGDEFRSKPTTNNLYFELGELKELYNDWKILHYAETEAKSHRTKSDGSPEYNTVAKLLAKK